MKYFALLIIIFLISCTQDNSIDPDLFIPSSAELNDKFDFEFVSKDTIRVFPKETANFPEPYFSSIIIGYKDEHFGFNAQDTLPANYTKIDNRYRLDFSFLFRITNLLDPYIFDHVEIQLRLMLNGRDFRSIAFNVYPHKFPYETAEIYLRKVDIKDKEFPQSHFIELHLNGDYLYFMTSPGGHRLYRYNRIKGELKLLMGAFTEFFTYHQGYLYGEFLGRRIVQYNISTSNFELEIGADLLANSVIRGIDIYKDNLYVLHSSNEVLLSSFKLDGQFIESIPFASGCWGFCIYQDIVYAINYYRVQGIEGIQLLRYSLSEGKFLTPLISPSDDLYAIQILNDTLYYALYWGYLICWIPLDNLHERINY